MLCPLRQGRLPTRKLVLAGKPVDPDLLGSLSPRTRNEAIALLRSIRVETARPNKSRLYDTASTRHLNSFRPAMSSLSG